jgi:flavorubredoxin
MDARVSEVAKDVFQVTVHVAEADLGMNQYLVRGDEPLLFHTGMRHQFPAVSGAIASVMPLAELRWVTFGHVEADECGAMNSFLAGAPAATVAHGVVGCMVSLSDLADREPRPLADGDVLDIGDHRIRWIDTPHLPHAWEAGLIYDETTRTLFCGDLFTRYGSYSPSTDQDIVTPAVEAERTESWSSWSLRPDAPARVRALAELPIDTLAPMHSSAYTGDCRSALLALAAELEVAAAQANGH